MSPKQKEELARIRAKNLANAVHYIWETGEDKYMLRYFHTGFWLSCEKHNDGKGNFSLFIINSLFLYPLGGNLIPVHKNKEKYVKNLSKLFLTLMS